MDLAYLLCQIWDEGSLFRAEVKNLAKSLMRDYYQLAPPPQGASEAAKAAHITDITRRVAILLDEANYLKDGVDEDVNFNCYTPLNNL
jgi:hypothetical protein